MITGAGHGMARRMSLAAAPPLLAGLPARVPGRVTGSSPWPGYRLESLAGLPARIPGRGTGSSPWPGYRLESLDDAIGVSGDGCGLQAFWARSSTALAMSVRSLRRITRIPLVVSSTVAVTSPSTSGQ
jgi:hypothetical protein